VDFLIAEVVLITTVRGAHADPEGLSAGSLIAKVIVPQFIASAVEGAARVLGARFFLRDYRHGTFQKMFRDQSIVSTFDGSTEVCLQSLASQLPALLYRNYAFEAEDVWGQYNVRHAVPALAYDRLQVTSRRGSRILCGLDDVVRRYGQNHPAQHAAEAISRRAGTELRRMADQAESAGSSRKWGASRSAEMSDVAYDYARVHALAACAAFGICNGGIVQSPACLSMMAQRLCGTTIEGLAPERTVVDELFDELRKRIERRELLSSLHSAGGTI
jgi:hypothetical protein